MKHDCIVSKKKKIFPKNIFCISIAWHNPKKLSMKIVLRAGHCTSNFNFLKNDLHVGTVELSLDPSSKLLHVASFLKPFLG